MNYPELVAPLIIGFILDAIFGDPAWLPHPIRLFGSAISLGEKRLNSESYRKFKGVILSSTLVVGIFLFLLIFLKLINEFEYLKIIISSLLVFYGLANHSLIKESVLVIQKLNKNGVESARKQLSMIVGRDTKNLSENEIRIAILETLSENLSDGVIAPLLYYFIGGIPAMFAYKMVNTLDSMVGYKNQRYKNFGWFAAKLDDIMNFIPARLTALLMVLVTFNFRGLKFIFKYGSKHSSPNAGYPEAALAGILNCRFGGSNNYHGVLVEKPYIGKNPRTVTNIDIYKACAINAFSAILLIGVFVALMYFV